MQDKNLKIEIAKKNQSKMRIDIDIDDIPTPSVIYFWPSREFFINRLGMELLGIKSNNLADVKKWWDMNPMLVEMLQRLKDGPISNQKYNVTLFNGKQDVVNLSSCYIQNTLMGEVFFIQLSKASDRCTMCTIATLFTIKEEIAKLKPYLNKTGKSIFDGIIKDFFPEKENQRLTLDDLVYYEKELRIIQKAYPFLSNREVILCTLLINNMSSANIANITNRSEGAVFVNIHRINKKLNLNGKNELIQVLRDLVKKEEDDWLRGGI